LPSYKDILVIRELRTRFGGANRTAFTSLVVSAEFAIYLLLYMLFTLCLTLVAFLIEIATNLKITKKEVI